MNVTPITVANTLLQNVQTQEQQISKLQQEESTGQSFQKPSDNPMAAENTLNFNNMLSQVSAFQTSSQNAMGWLNQTSGVMTNMLNLWDQVLQTATQASNSTNDQADLNAIANTVSQMQANFGQMLNTQYQGSYIFSGYNYSAPPVPVPASGQYPTSAAFPTTTNGQSQNFLVNTGVNIPVNLTGWENAGQPAGTNYFAQAYNDIGALATAIKAGPSHVQSMLSQLQNDLGNLNAAQAIMGGNMQRVQNTMTQLTNASNDINQNLAQVAGANMAQVTTQLAQEQTAYQATLQSGAQILSLSLLNFINP